MLKEYTLQNSNGVSISFLNYGGILTSIKTPDKNGKIEEILLGFDTAERYTGKHPYMSGIIGRYANRIANGCFTIDGETHQLTTNDGDHHLHGGNKGFDKVYWTVVELGKNNLKAGEVGFRLAYVSNDGEEGFPGNLGVTVDYILNEDNAFSCVFRAISDRKTVVNLTNHPTFNLSGNPRERNVHEKNVLDHDLEIHARYYLKVNEALIPTGEMPVVEGTALDFRSMKKIGRDIEQVGEYDHCLVIDKKVSGLEKVATLREAKSGRKMEIHSTELGLQIYSGSALEGIEGRDGFVYKRYNGICLEPQRFPDAPNNPKVFPTSAIEIGEGYAADIVYVFGLMDG